MTTWTTGVCTTNGIGIHYLRTGGAKPPLLLLHGLLGSGACWTQVARALESEYDVVMIDARGHGQSSKPDQGYRYDDHADDVMGLIRTLGLASPVVVGHSMGGMTAAVVASRAGRSLRGVVLVDPTFLGPERQREVHESDVAAQHRRWVEQGKSALLADLRARHTHRSPELVELLAEARMQTSMSVFEVLTPPNPDYRELVNAIDIPVLLAIGDNPVVSRETARDLHDLNPLLCVEEIPGAGHGVPFDQPERLAAVVGSFIRSLASDGFA